ncbi:MAG: Transglutaminase-like superfamily protein [bacterium ADurb.Bin400]|nr:MAG: Transglutaminase-like superfamily protein [bacterium ADurb.Bin400]
MEETRLSQAENMVETQAADFDVDTRLGEVLRGEWQGRLQTESYEEASESLGEVRALREWRRETGRSTFSPFYQLFESAGAINGSELTGTEAPLLREALVDRLIGQSRHLSPRVSDLYQALLAELEGSAYNPEFESTSAKVQELRESGDLDLLFDGNVPYAVKLNRIKTRLEGELSGRSALDRRDKKAKETTETSESTNQPQTPPPTRDESKPSMDEMERSKEGETPSAIWTIAPGYGGYYREQSFDTWDTATNTWRQSEYRFSSEQKLEFDSDTWFDRDKVDKDTIRIRATLVPGQATRVPIPYTHYYSDHVPLYSWPEKGSDRLEVTFDQNGDAIVTLIATEPRTVQLVLLKDAKKLRHGRGEMTSPPHFELQGLSPETLERLQEIHRTKKGNLAKARAAAGWTMRRLKYSNVSSFNQTYDTDPRGYIAAIDEHKQADCDVANTYFAGLCSALGIPVRHVVGHMVKGKDDEGHSRITSGTGHAWSEIWDDQANEWVRIDATPAGDPQLEEQQKSNGPVPGDYGEQEAVGPTDEQLAKLEEDLASLTERLSYTQSERELSEAAGVELPEARQIVKEITEAENTRLPDGKRVVDLLSQLFSLIVEARKTVIPDYTGPLRKREGGEEIDDIVAHKIGIRAGETDPRSRQKEYEQPHVEQVYSGFDVYLSGDKSGSMGQTVDGETKWRMQRRAAYLIFSSLYRFGQNLDRAGLRSTEALSLRSEGLSFRDSETIDVDKPISGEFTASDKVTMWHSLGNQGSGNGDVASLSYIRDQIAAEREAAEASGKTDNRLRIVIACSDGYPDNPAGVRELARQLAEMNAVVIGIGLTETAASIPIIFNVEDEQGRQIARGDIARDINDLPAIVAKHVVREAVRLFPEKSRKSAERIMAAILDKFNQVG